ncbi:phospholipid phosphatase 2b [Aplochiton taeniatus]
MKDMRKKKLYVVVDVLCVVVAALPCLIMTCMFRPYHRGVFCDDESIQYPLKPDTITHGLLAAVTISCTVIIVCSGEAYLVYSKRVFSNSDFNQYVAALYKVLGTFLFGAVVSQSLTDLAKFTIGRPRPNFMAVCAPRVCLGYVEGINCTGAARDVTESRLSFYSGHSSFGMYCMLFLAVSIPPLRQASASALLDPLDSRAVLEAMGLLLGTMLHFFLPGESSTDVWLTAIHSANL